VTTYDALALAARMDAQEFDHVWTIDAETLDVLDAPDGIYAPDVVNDETDDVVISPTYHESGPWEAVIGMTGQYGYHGAVMHPSEYIGAGMAEEALRIVTDVCEDGQAAYFAVTEVRDEDGSYPDGDPIGWALTYTIA
jgi:hypothetical protein